MLLTTQNNDLIIAPLLQYKGMDVIPPTVSLQFIDLLMRIQLLHPVDIYIF